MEKQAQELAQDLVSYLDVTGKAINVALTEVKKADVEKKAAQELIPALVDQLVSAKLLTDADRKQAQEFFRVLCQEMRGKWLAKRSQAQPSP